MNATPLTLDNLEAVTAKYAALQNAVLAAIGGRLYHIAEQQLIWGLSKDGDDEALKVALQFNGQNIMLGLSQSLVDALLQQEGVSLSDINIDVLNLLVRLKAVPKLPQGVQYKGLSLGRINTLEQAFKSLPKQVTLCGATQSGELLNWNIAIYAMPQTSLGAFLKGFDFLVAQTMLSPLLKAKVPMPIVAARTAIPAEQLRDIAVGDVILFG
jgi:hypothetical protein